MNNFSDALQEIYQKAKDHKFVKVEEIGGDGFACEFRDMRVYCIVSESIELDNRLWVHVSCSKRNKVPSWVNLKRVKDALLGGDKVAYQVFPKEENYVNIDPNVLHFFHCPSETVLPEFSRGLNTI